MSQQIDPEIHNVIQIRISRGLPKGEERGAWKEQANSKYIWECKQFLKEELRGILMSNFKAYYQPLYKKTDMANENRNE